VDLYVNVPQGIMPERAVRYCFRTCIPVAICWFKNINGYP